MKILATALLLGIAGDLLLRGMPPGLNVLLWTILLLAGFAYVIRDAGAMITGSIGALIGAIGMTWRSCDPLVAFDFLLLFFSFALLTLRARGVREWAAGVARVAAALVMSAALSVAGIVQVVFADVPWRALQPGRAGRRAIVAVRGFLIALPLLIIFAALLTSADPAFASIFADLFTLDVQQALGHAGFALFIALPVAGFLRSTLRGPKLPDVPRPSFFHLGAGETNVAIALIDILFAGFVAVQIRYFFGGAALVKVAPNLTYADYARRGFFELVTVVALVVPLLLLAEWLIDKTNMTMFRILAAVQVLLVGVILISAYRRMQLYVDEFGLTRPRIITTAFMFFLAALLAWFCATVLSGHRQRFLIGAFAAGVIVIITLHAINPDALIVRTNMANTKRSDREFLTKLSDDAVPALHELMPAGACVGRKFSDDWRTWNASRSEAARICGR